jgi:hypothetical protein
MSGRLLGVRHFSIAFRTPVLAWPLPGVMVHFLFLRFSKAKCFPVVLDFLVLPVY